MKLKNSIEKKVPIVGWADKLVEDRAKDLKNFLSQYYTEDMNIFDKDDISFFNIAYVSLEDSETLNSIAVYIIKRKDELQIANSPTYMLTEKFTYTVEENGRKNYKVLGKSIDIINSKTEATAYTLSLGHNSKFKKDMENIIGTDDFTKDNIIKNIEDMIKDNDKYDDGIFASTGVMLSWDGYCHFVA